MYEVVKYSRQILDMSRPNFLLIETFLTNQVLELTLPKPPRLDSIQIANMNGWDKKVLNIQVRLWNVKTKF
jgi:hypothetical protein